MTQVTDDYALARENMIEQQVRPWDVLDARVLDVLRQVPRHHFAPAPYRSVAYADVAIPIGHGEKMMKPVQEGRMLQALELTGTEQILEIGTGSGYQAAVLAEIVDQVYTLEIVPELGEKAKAVLGELGYDNIHVRVADGYNGWEEHAPFDAIVVTAAADHIPPSLTEQLKEGGKMIIPIDSGEPAQQLVLVEKTGGKISQSNVLPVRFVPFTRSK